MRTVARAIRLVAAVGSVLVATGLLAACETGNYPLDIFPEMHYQQPHRTAEPPFAGRPEGQVPFGPPAARELPPAGAEPALTDFATALAAGNPVPSDDQSIERGHELFVINCAMCHGAGADGHSPTAEDFAEAGEKPPPSLLRDGLEQTPDGALFWTITNGVGQMPSFKRLLTAEERWTVINYIRSLR